MQCWLCTQVTYTERGALGQEEWLELERTQFVWLSARTAGPNPTFHPAKTPQGQAALQHRVCLPQPRPRALHPWSAAQ